MIGALKLKEYDYEIVYRYDSKHGDADALPQSPLIHSANEEVLEYLPLAVRYTLDMVQEKSLDPSIKKTIISPDNPTELTQRTLISFAFLCYINRSLHEGL